MPCQFRRRAIPLPTDPPSADLGAAVSFSAVGNQLRVGGIFFGRTRAEMRRAGAALRRCRDGIAGRLDGPLGQSWPAAVLTEVHADGPVRQSAGGLVFRAYKAIFEHM